MSDASLDKCIEPTAAKPDSTRPSSAAKSLGVDDSLIAASYAMFCRVTGTPEELFIGFGLNAEPVGATTDPASLQRIVTNYNTAKRLLSRAAAVGAAS